MKRVGISPLRHGRRRGRLRPVGFRPERRGNQHGPQSHLHLQFRISPATFIPFASDATLEMSLLLTIVDSISSTGIWIGSGKENKSDYDYRMPYLRSELTHYMCTAQTALLPCNFNDSCVSPFIQLHLKRNPLLICSVQSLVTFNKTCPLESNCNTGHGHFNL